MSPKLEPPFLVPGGVASAVIKVSGRLTSDRSEYFKAHCDAALAQREAKKIVVDLSRAHSLDSTGLAMLLVLLAKAKAADKSVTLSGAQGMVEDALRISNIGNLFSRE